MLCITLKREQVSDIQLELKKFNGIDFYEIRADALKYPMESRKELIDLFNQYPHKRFVLTYRSKQEGGRGSGLPNYRMAFFSPFFNHPNLILDLEMQRDLFFPRHRLAKVMASYHGSQSKASTLSPPKDCDYVKWCVSFKNATQALLFASKKASSNTICISLHPQHQFLRCMYPFFHMPWMYTYLSHQDSSYSSQLSYDSFYKTYHLQKQEHPLKGYFALLGQPIESSPSFHTHNRFFYQKNLPYRYVKIPIQPRELKPFLKVCEKLQAFKGFSITMPLKEEAGRYLKKLGSSTSYPSINTLLLGRAYQACNTDVEAVFSLLKHKGLFPQARIGIIGSGGVAKSLMLYGLEKGHPVSVFSRSHVRCSHKNLNLNPLENLSRALQENALDVLVQATPVGMKGYPQTLPLRPEDLHPNLLVVEMVSTPRWTPLLKGAKKQGCTIISGKKVFFQQAYRQWQFFMQCTQTNLSLSPSPS